MWAGFCCLTHNGVAGGHLQVMPEEEAVMDQEAEVGGSLDRFLHVGAFLFIVIPGIIVGLWWGIKWGIKTAWESTR